MEKEIYEEEVDSILASILNIQDQPFRTEITPDPSLVPLLIAKAQSLFLSEPCLLSLSAPVKIIGDLHGQIFDLLRILEENKYPPYTQYLFLGAYVNRGFHSLETIILLLALKVKFPDHIMMLRGRHECRTMNRLYQLYDNCKKRYSIKIWKQFNNCFDCMPLAAIVDNSYFCVHGGLSPELSNVEQINNIKRPIDVQEQGIVTDLIFSDSDLTTEGWNDSPKGVHLCFGKDVLREFLEVNNLKAVIRGKEPVMNGFEVCDGGNLVTVFSSPNYCLRLDNEGAYLSLNEDLKYELHVMYPRRDRKLVRYKKVDGDYDVDEEERKKEVRKIPRFIKSLSQFKWFK